MRSLRRLSIYVLSLFVIVCAVSVRSRAMDAAAADPAAQANDSGASTRASLKGRVTDPTGAVIAHAKVTVTAAGGVVRQTATDQKGEFHFTRLPAGPVSVSVIAAGFTPYVQDQVLVRSGSPALLKIQMLLGTQQQQVVVQAQSVGVDLQPDDKAGAVVVSGKALKSLPDDPDELATDLQAMAGPAMGGGTGDIYIDGFTGGDLPPKSAIREVRVNSDPYSARFQHPGHGRIEILTKPGADRYHGSFFVNGNSASLNSLNPFLRAAGSKPPAYHSTILNGDLGGPIGKKTSFFLGVQHRNIHQVSVVDTETLGPDLTPQPYLTSVSNPDRFTSVAPRVDVQLTPENILTVRYNYQSQTSKNEGIGSQSLPSQAYDFTRHHHNLQVTDSQILSPQVVNEIAVQYLHFVNVRTVTSSDPTLDVLGAFTGGGSSLGNWNRNESHLQVHEDLSWQAGPHQVEMGGRLREVVRTESAAQNFNGTFTFKSLNDYAATGKALDQGMSMARIQAAGYGPTQFTITSGNPLAHVQAANVALYAQDAWKLRRNVLVSYGLRFETENWIHDHADWAPRVGLAWGLGGGDAPKTVLRAGFGVFYERFDDDQMITAERMNGINQLQYLVAQPDFFTPLTTPDPTLYDTAPGVLPTVYRIAPNLRSPFLVDSSIGIERQLGAHATMKATYTNARGEDQFLTNDINAPLPGTYLPDVPSSGVRPYGAAAGNIDEYQSAGMYRENRVMVNFRAHPTSEIFLFGYYSWDDAHSDTTGPDSFPINPWNIAADYAASSFDIHHRVFFGGRVPLPWGFDFSPFLVAHSGAPFSITLGQDLFGTGINNGRPALAGPSTPAADVKQTPYGAFDLHPGPGDSLIPRNTLWGPAAFALNLRVGKTFQFGGVKSGAAVGSRHDKEDQRYQLNLSVQARNLFNNVNLGTPVGNLNSPLFGRSITLAGGPFSSGAANRRVELQARFGF